MPGSLPIRDDKILVSLDSKYVYISKDVFKRLFENSHVYYLTDYKKAFSDNKIKFRKLVALSRKAGIPYSLFFAPIETVEKNIKRNGDILFQGVSEGMVSIAGRGDVRINDVNLIVKDIQKRQFFMSKHKKETDENLIFTIDRNRDVELFAKEIINTVHLDMKKFWAYGNKGKAYDFLVDSLEESNIMISRSRLGYMPQAINPDVYFSGFVVKNKKFPTIFLYTKDENDVSDPAGRRIFTIMLLLACMANKRFAMVSYDQSVKDIIKNFEYQVAEEILMPRSAIDGMTVGSTLDIKALADNFKVTPSMVLMRMKRLGLVSNKDFDKFYNEITEERRAALSANKETYHYNPKDITKIVTYNGKLFCNEVIDLLRSKQIDYSTASRLLLFRKKDTKIINTLMDAL